jgi:molybdopterin-guanine dinucleotide biosynthesis protein
MRGKKPYTLSRNPEVRVALGGPADPDDDAEEEEEEDDWLPDSEKTPVTIVTGFLGSGKTTLINYILTENHGKRIAIIENEFGAIDIDSSLISSNAKLTAKEDVISMDNGCVCCTVRGDLVNAFKSLSARADKYDAVMIETTGMADPAPVAFTFNTQPEVGARFKIDAILCVVDCKHIQQHLDDVVPFSPLLCPLSSAEIPPAHARGRARSYSGYLFLNFISFIMRVTGREEADG